VPGALCAGRPCRRIMSLSEWTVVSRYDAACSVDIQFSGCGFSANALATARAMSAWSSSTETVTICIALSWCRRVPTGRLESAVRTARMRVKRRMERRMAWLRNPRFVVEDPELNASSAAKTSQVSRLYADVRVAHLALERVA
jgi:hypothetical protein